MTKRKKRRTSTPGPKPASKPASPQFVGPFGELVSRNPPLGPKELREQRTQLIREIEKLRERRLLVYATDASPQPPRVSGFIHREDLVPLSELLDSIEGDQIDVLLETPGGLAEVTVEIVALLRRRFDHVGFIIPHMAMSAGTILVMSGDEILMDHRSSLGPIDPQFMPANGRPQPAQALIEGFEAIKAEVAESGSLNPAFLPVLRNVDPGQLQTATNASELSSSLVADWLCRYKFRDWTTHSSTGDRVTEEERAERARFIASELCKHARWLSHGRPIKIEDLEELGLKITNYADREDLQRAIWGLWVNIHHLLSSTNIYKLFETAEAQLVKIAILGGVGPSPAPAKSGKALADFRCAKCNTSHRLQIDLGVANELEEGALRFPKSCRLKCRGCGDDLDLRGLKLALEAQMGQPIDLK